MKYTAVRSYETAPLVLLVRGSRNKLSSSNDTRTTFWFLLFLYYLLIFLKGWKGLRIALYVRVDLVLTSQSVGIGIWPANEHKQTGQL